jgi:hexosaminidase
MKKSVLLLLICWISVFFSFGQSPIIPSPVVYKMGVGVMSIGNHFSIDSENLPTEIKDFLVQKLVDIYSIQTVVSTSGRDLKFKKIANTPPDFYSITINDEILIQYSSPASCFYAVNSLLQLIEGEKESYYFSKAFVQDYPNFQWRGLHLDVSRHFFSVEEVKRFIDLMALYKFNTFHWHLTDDQGWRIEIKKYPKLTEIGAWRDSTVIGHYSATPRTYSVERYGGFYTQDQIKEVVAYAGKKFITVVPEIEMPGHSRAALAAYPEYSCTGKKLEVPGLWGVFEEIFCAKEESIDFLKDVLSEVVTLFPSEYIHIGGDEAPKTRWKSCPRCQKVIRENGLKDEHELQSFFIQEIDEFLTSKGRKLIGWDEILEGGLSPNAAVMSWRGFEGGIEAAKQKHFAVMSPGSHCYFDHYQSKNPNEPTAIGGFTPLEKVYTFNPIPTGFTEQQSFFIIGGQANLWTEYIPTMAQLEYMTYPRALALAQVLWCKQKPPFEVFKKSFEDYQLTYLKRYNVNYSKAFFYPQLTIFQNKNGLKLHFKGATKEDVFQLETHTSEKDNQLSTVTHITQNDTILVNRSKDNQIHTFNFKLSPEKSSDSAFFELKTHPSIGLPIVLITQPSEQYKGDGALTLVDGVIGVTPWKGNEWLGFDTTQIEFIVDLTKKVKIEEILLNFLQDDGSWIHSPESIQIAVSKNKKNWRNLEPQKFTASQSSNAKKAGMKNAFEQNIDLKGRFVKVKVNCLKSIPIGFAGEGKTPWTFTDELILLYYK